MARLLAIDWDGTEARYVVADARGGSLSFEAAGSVPHARGDRTRSGRVPNWPRHCGEHWPARRAARRRCVSIDRSQIELVSLTLPPASDAELPEMVRNQAMRENNAIAEDAALDFVPLGDNANEPRKVTAVALSQTRLEQVQTVLDRRRRDGAVHHACDRMRPRPWCWACSADRNETCLVMHVLAEEVDLIVLSGGQTVFWRTLRQPNASRDDAARARRLLAEIQRTLLVAQPQLAGLRRCTRHICAAAWTSIPALSRSCAKDFRCR